MKRLLIIAAIFSMLSSISCDENTTPSPSVSEPYGDNSITPSLPVDESSEDDSITPSLPVDESSEDDSEITLTIATTFDIHNLKSMISKNLNCDVDIKYYPDNEEGEPFEKLYIDMNSGKFPDVIYSDPDNMINLINKNYMTDMYPLMENSETLKKEDFLPNVLEGLDVDGKLPAICDLWELSTAVAKTENVGENMENWTPAEALDIYNNMPEDMNFIDYSHFNYDELNHDYDELNYFMRRISVDAVDYKNNTCDFGGVFMEMLGNVKNFPPFDENKTFENDDLIENRSLVNIIRFFSLDSSLAQQLYFNFGGADITFVGFPSESGKGYVTKTPSMLGIIENSQHKQKSYEFISLMLNNEAINPNPMLPVTEKQLENQLKKSKYDGASINCPQSFPNSNEQVQMPEKAINQAVDYIKNVEFEPYKRSEVDSIISEEYHKCFEGETTPQECADMLNDRVSAYLSEKE